MAECSPQTLLESGKCFQCLSKKELQIVIAQLLCQISTDGIGQITTAEGDVFYAHTSGGNVVWTQTP